MLTTLTRTRLRTVGQTTANRNILQQLITAPEAAEALASVRTALEIWERDTAREEESQARFPVDSAELKRAASRARAQVPSPEQVRFRVEMQNIRERNSS